MNIRNLLTAITVVAGIAISAGIAEAKDWNKLRVGVEGAYPPFSWMEPDGTLKGFDIDIALAVCEHMNAECNHLKSAYRITFMHLRTSNNCAGLESKSCTVKYRFRNG